MRHAEPWDVYGRCRDECGNVNCDLAWVSGGVFGQGTGFAEEDAQRVVACVNACAGIDDPAEALREAREALEEVAEYLDQRADADCTDDGHYFPNEEMALHARVADALRLLTP